MIRKVGVNSKELVKEVLQNNGLQLRTDDAAVRIEKIVRTGGYIKLIPKRTSARKRDLRKMWERRIAQAAAANDASIAGKLLMGKKTYRAAGAGLSMRGMIEKE